MGNRRTIREAEYFRKHDRNRYSTSWMAFSRIQGIMPRPKSHYTMVVKNHVTGERLKVDLIDLPFAENRRFRLRVNGQWATKLPVASKTVVAKQVRAWLVKH